MLKYQTKTIGECAHNVSVPKDKGGGDFKVHTHFIPLSIILLKRKLYNITYFFQKRVFKISKINMTCKWLTVFLSDLN